jgi:membrane protein YqaA with SNARE-associated domain
MPNADIEWSTSLRRWLQRRRSGGSGDRRIHPVSESLRRSAEAPLRWSSSRLDGRRFFLSTCPLMSETNIPGPTTPIKRPHFMRRLYNWTVSWAERPGGAWALFFLAVAESSFFPIPPDVLLLALCVGAVKKSFRFALICSVGSVIGGVIGYGIGLWGYDLIGKPVVDFYQGQEVMDKVKGWYETYGFWGNLLAAITPIPYKVFTIASGVFEFSFWKFLLASVIGRSFRFFLVAGFLYLFGARMKALIEKYFDLFMWLFLVLLVLGFVAIKFVKN